MPPPSLPLFPFPFSALLYKARRRGGGPLFFSLLGLEFNGGNHFFLLCIEKKKSDREKRGAGNPAFSGSPSLLCLSSFRSLARLNTDRCSLLLLLFLSPRFCPFNEEQRRQDVVVVVVSGVPSPRCLLIDVSTSCGVWMCVYMHLLPLLSQWEKEKRRKREQV